MKELPPDLSPQRTRRPTLEEAEQFMWDAQLYNRVDFAGHWRGWRMRGMWLVSPHGDRIKCKQLENLLFQYALRCRGSSVSVMSTDPANPNAPLLRMPAVKKPKVVTAKAPTNVVAFARKKGRVG